MAYPLRGIKVLEMEGLAPTVLAGQILADLGADVTIISRPEPPSISAEMSTNILNRGKKSIVFDLKKADDLKCCQLMLDACDVFIDSLRPGAMEKLGLGPIECLKRNPRLIYARISSFGQGSKLSQQAGHDINFLSYSGVLSMLASTGNDPTKPQPPAIPANIVGDFAAGSCLGVVGILAALSEVQKGGNGQVVDLGMAQASLYLSQFVLSGKANGTWNRPLGHNLLDGGAHFYNVYRCRDDRFVSVGCIEGKFYAEWVDRLRRAGGDSKLCDQLAEEQLNVDRWIEFKVAVGNIYLTKTRDEWTEVFAGSEACCAPVYDASELKATGNKYLGYPNRPFLINGQGHGPYEFEVAPQPLLSNSPAKTIPSRIPFRGEHQALKPKL